MPCYAKDRAHRASLLLLALLTGMLSGCDEGGVNAQRVIVAEDAAHLSALILEDFDRTRVGVRACATRLAPGFAVADPEQRRSELRLVLGMLRDVGRPRMRVPELLGTPLTFVATVGTDGHVIARDPNPDEPEAPDLMAGLDVSALGPVRTALDQHVEAEGLVDFPGARPEDPSLPLWLVAVPALHHGETVGVVIGGIPLWRIAQKLSRQLQAEAGTDGSIHWIYLYRGDELFHHGTPDSLDSAMPDAARRAEGLATSPGGFTHGFLQHGRWYGWGVLPTPWIGEDVGLIIVRADPLEE